MTGVLILTLHVAWVPPSMNKMQCWCPLSPLRAYFLRQLPYSTVGNAHFCTSDCACAPCRKTCFKVTGCSFFFLSMDVDIDAEVLISLVQDRQVT